MEVASINKITSSYKKDLDKINAILVVRDMLLWLEREFSIKLGLVDMGEYIIAVARCSDRWDGYFLSRFVSSESRGARAVIGLVSKTSSLESQGFESHPRTFAQDLSAPAKLFIHLESTLPLR